MASAYSSRYSQPVRPVSRADGDCGIPQNDNSHFLHLLGAVPVQAANLRLARFQQLLNDEDVTTVGQLAEAMAMSQARLARFCRNCYGTTPKVMLRRYRLARMLKALQHRPYCEWRQFLDIGYTDQSHFIREFKSFLGMPPSQYLSQLQHAA